MARTPTIMAAAIGVALACAGLADGAAAQASGPSEPPPPDFAAEEFVDADGCAFVRVEVGDRVEWAPRVGPDRQPLCGFTPTQIDGMPAVAGTTRPVQRPETRVAAPPPRATPPQGLPRRAAVPAAPRGPRVAMAPVPGAHAPPAQGPAGERRAATAPVLLPPSLDADDVRVRAACLTVSGRAMRYRAASDPRCHPEPMHPPALVHGDRRPATPAAGPVTALRVERPSVPPGYRLGWRDGRLNPYRGIRTETGEAEMRMIWTDTVPRRAVRAE
ncbi:MAG: hypothetical protein ACOCYW_04935 [Roseicyclus sp.]